MGFITDLARGAQKGSFSGTNRGSALWREIFGDTDKERTPPKPNVTPGGSWANTSSAAASYKKLLQALRSEAPGGWTDDRYEQSKHFIGAVYVAVDRISKQMQRSEFQVFQKDPQRPDGKRPITPDDRPHPGKFVRPYQLVELLERPNKQDSWGKLMYRYSQQMRLTGTALTMMVPNELGIPMELYSIPTCIAIPQAAINLEYPHGYYRIQPIYPYGPFSSYPTPNSAVGAPVPAEWMLKFLYPHPFLRYEGYSPLTGMRNPIDQLESMDRSRWYKMKKSINPSGVLNFSDVEGMETLPQVEIERIHAEWEKFQGPENHGELIIGAPGSELVEFGSSPKDMDYPQGWEQMMSFILGGGFGITKPAAGLTDDSSYAQLFATLKQLYLLTLDPDCDDIASELTRHLAPFFGDDLIVEIRCRRIDDHDIKNGETNILIQAKAITKNEVRVRYELEPTEEGWGEEIAGFEAPPDQGQGMPGMEEGAEQGGDVLDDVMNEEKESERPEPPDVTQNRDGPDELGIGALGPRMAIKGFYAMVREVCHNGSH